MARMQKHAKQKHKEDDRSEQPVIKLQALLPVNVHKICQIFSRNSSSSNSNLNHTICAEACQQMKLVDVKVTLDEEIKQKTTEVSPVEKLDRPSLKQKQKKTRLAEEFCHQSPHY